MAAATNVSRPFNNVDGSLREKYYTAVTIAANGDTLNTGMKTIFMIDVGNTAVVTGYTAAGGVITFNATGAGTFPLQVTGR